MAQTRHQHASLCRSRLRTVLNRRLSCRMLGHETEISGPLRSRFHAGAGTQAGTLGFPVRIGIEGKDAEIAASLSRSIANGEPACCLAREVDQFVHGP